MHESACQNSDQSCLACALASVAPLYWQHETQRERDNLEMMIENFWAQTKTNHGPPGNPTTWPIGDNLAEIQEDADEFLTWLLQVWRAEDTGYSYVSASLIES